METERTYHCSDCIQAIVSGHWPTQDTLGLIIWVYESRLWVTDAEASVLAAILVEIYKGELNNGT